MAYTIGTTPTFVLEFSAEEVDLAEAENLYVTIKQGHKELTYTGDDLVLEGNSIKVYLPQEESLKFKPGIIEIQANWTYGDGDRACSDIVQLEADRNLLMRFIE